MLTVCLQSCTNAMDLECKAIIECLPGDTLKWELDHQSKVVVPDSIDGQLRILKSGFPTYYGFIESFKSQDGDFLDCFIFSDIKKYRQDTSSWKVLALIKVLDEGEEDCKLILANRPVSDDEILDIVGFLTTYSDDEVHVQSFLRVNDIAHAINEIEVFRKSKSRGSHIYIGHAYGTPRVHDRNMDSVVYKVQQINWNNEFFLLGD